MEKLLSKLPQLFPLRGKCIIAFTAEQVATYKMKIFGDDIKIQIDTSWHPDEHSIEEAIIVTTNPTQTKLQPGDGVLVRNAVADDPVSDRALEALCKGARACSGRQPLEVRARILCGEPVSVGRKLRAHAEQHGLSLNRA